MRDGGATVGSAYGSPTPKVIRACYRDSSLGSQFQLKDTAHDQRMALIKSNQINPKHGHNFGGSRESPGHQFRRTSGTGSFGALTIWLAVA